MKILEQIKNFKITKKKLLIIILLIILLISIISLFFILIKEYITKNNKISNIVYIQQYNYENCEQIYNTDINSNFINSKNKDLFVEKVNNCDSMYNNIDLFFEKTFTGITDYEFPLSYEYDFVTSTVLEGEKYDYEFEIDNDIDFDKSSFEVYFSNDNLEILENIIGVFPDEINGNIQDLISFLYIKNLYLINKDKIINSNLNNSQTNKEILQKIYSYQLQDGGFKKYNPDLKSDLDISIFVGEYLKKLSVLGVLVKKEVLQNFDQYLLDNNYNFNQEEYIDKLKYDYVNKTTTIIEKAILLSSLLDNNYDDKIRLDQIVNDLNKTNIKDYFLSSQEKLHLFESLIKYVNKYSINENKSKFGFMLGTLRNFEKLFWIGRVVPSYKHYIYNANEIIYDNEASFRIANIEGFKINFGVYFKKYIKNLQDEIQNDNLGISRKIYNITSLFDLKKCYLSGNINCREFYKEKNDSSFNLGEIYKVNINIKNNKIGEELILENFIPNNFSFVSIDDKYQVIDYRDIDYKNNILKVIFDGKQEINFSYYIKAIEKGQSIYYGALSYLYDNNKTLSKTNDIQIEIK